MVESGQFWSGFCRRFPVSGGAGVEVRRVEMAVAYRWGRSSLSGLVCYVLVFPTKDGTQKATRTLLRVVAVFHRHHKVHGDHKAKVVSSWK